MCIFQIQNHEILFILLSKWCTLFYINSIKRYGDAEEGQVWFGVGTFGTGDDEMMGLGNCYR